MQYLVVPELIYNGPYHRAHSLSLKKMDVYPKQKFQLRLVNLSFTQNASDIVITESKNSTIKMRQTLFTDSLFDSKSHKKIELLTSFFIAQLCMLYSTDWKQNLLCLKISYANVLSRKKTYCNKIYKAKFYTLFIKKN